MDEPFQSIAKDFSEMVLSNQNVRLERSTFICKVGSGMGLTMFLMFSVYAIALWYAEGVGVFALLI